ncbi:TPA_asm: hypothetical protein [Altiarchaeum virus]|nr:TPA_asm: hypothetical protein [Altiarchaeum virus]
MIKFFGIEQKKGTKGVTEEGITATEKFQRVFLRLFENIEKIPKSVSEIFVSNIMRRTLSYNIFSTIDQKTGSFWKEKIFDTEKKYAVTTSNDMHVYPSYALSKKAKGVGISIYNMSAGVCNVHITTTDGGDLYFFQIQGDSVFSFQFELFFPGYLINLRQLTANGNVTVSTNYSPL